MWTSGRRVASEVRGGGRDAPPLSAAHVRAVLHPPRLQRPRRLPPLPALGGRQVSTRAGISLKESRFESRAFNNVIKFAKNITLTITFHISILQGSPSCSPEPDMLKKTEMGNTMPRSLTIDEMEHICRCVNIRVGHAPIFADAHQMRINAHKPHQ